MLSQTGYHTHRELHPSSLQRRRLRRCLALAAVLHAAMPDDTPPVVHAPSAVKLHSPSDTEHEKSPALSVDAEGRRDTHLVRAPLSMPPLYVGWSTALPSVHLRNQIVVRRRVRGRQKQLAPVRCARRCACQQVEHRAYHGRWRKAGGRRGNSTTGGRRGEVEVRVLSCACCVLCGGV
jgi:hypothetical protein